MEILLLNAACDLDAFVLFLISGLLLLSIFSLDLDANDTLQENLHLVLFFELTRNTCAFPFEIMFQSHYAQGTGRHNYTLLLAAFLSPSSERRCPCDYY